MPLNEIRRLSENAEYIISAGVDGYTPSGFSEKIKGDEAVEYAIGDLFLKYSQGKKHLAMMALEEIAQQYVRDKTSQRSA